MKQKESHCCHLLSTDSKEKFFVPVPQNMLFLTNL